MSNFDAPILKKLRTDIENLLKSDDFSKLCEKYGITANLGSGKYTQTECTFPLKLKADGAATTDFENYSTLFGLQPTDLGKVIVVGGYAYTITGINPNAPKYPVNGTRQDGKKFKFSADTVKRALAKNREQEKTVV